VYGEVAEACAGLGLDYIVVGAAARDLVFHHVHGVPITRATSDVDFGLKVKDWDAFYRLRDALIGRGYNAKGSQHRLFSPHGTQVDVIPFGQVADSNSTITWPPDGETKMSVLGFREAHDHSDLICIQDEPRLDIRVVTPAGMALLKIIAWTDRALDLRTKDAKDVLHLLRNYQKIREVLDAVYDDAELGERHEWDVELMSAEIFGRRTRAIASPETSRVVVALADDANAIDSLAWEMSDGIDDLLERSRPLLTAFFDGFRVNPGRR